MQRGALLLGTVLPLGAVVLLAGCATAGGPAPSGSGRVASASASGSSSRPASATPSVIGTATSGTVSRSAVPSPSPATSTASAPPPAPTAAALLARMSEAERVGQLLMVDCPTTYVAAATVTAIVQDHVGSVILDGTSMLGLDGTARVTAHLESDNPSPAALFIATDQEGGLVQRLQGPGFTRIPSAVVQGQEDPATLQQQARGWAAELARAGVNVDLAPVLDTVPADSGPNPPIGDLDREYGHTPDVVSSHGVAVALGLAAAGVDATIKHFPGLGRVTGNTDTASGVTDTVTTAQDPYLAPFAAAIKAGVPFVMMSTAVYSRIDPTEPAAFSATVIGGILRGDLGFAGVVVSDDLGAAAQVSNLAPGDRAVRFIQAGGDLVLTVDASQAAPMTEALLAATRTDPTFKQKVDAAALRILTAKQARGLLG